MNKPLQQRYFGCPGYSARAPTCLRTARLAGSSYRPIQFYNCELVKVTVSPQTEFETDKIVRTRKKGGIKQYLVKWRGYDETFNSSVNESDMKKI